ncbi:MAG: uroporphyrinogen decarboxylase family protein [Anaerolineae bacterium]|nr:uroporphyrinogen decarboxylase family protein [Anaerolineae bacterium]
MTPSFSSLSHRERVRLALDHQTTDRIPIALVCSGINAPAQRALETHLQQTRGLSVEAYLDPLIDVREIVPPYSGPLLLPDEDIWGVRRAPVSYGADSYDEIAYYPLASAETPADLDAHRWPSADWFDYDALAAIAAADGDHCLMAANGNIFERSWYMRGFEQMFMDFVLNPELAHAIMERVTTFFCAYFDRALAACEGRIDLAFTADDIGGQNGLLMSLPMWEAFIKPYHLRLNAVIHRHGARVIYHTDGSVMPAVPGLMDMGIDVLQALQFSARGMDPVALKRDHGDRLCFEGGVCVQKTLPFGTPDEVADEVRARIDVLGAQGGYILGPSHYIQANTPPENITALFDTAAGFYPHG